MRRHASRWSRNMPRRRGCSALRRRRNPVFTQTIELDLSTVVPSMAGPKRPEGRIALGGVAAGFKTALASEYKKTEDAAKRYPVAAKNFDLGHGDVVIAAITSCTNTSNPSVLIGAGLLARNAVARGLSAKPWVQDLACTGEPGRRRISRQFRAAERPRQARLQSRRLRLHDLHRQQRAAAAGDFRHDQPERHRRRGGALRQPQFRGPRQPRRAGELSRLTAARRPPMRLRGSVGKDLETEPLGVDKHGNSVYLRGHLAEHGGDQCLLHPLCDEEGLQEPLCGCLRWRHALAQGESPGRRNLSLGHRLARPMCRTRPISRG